MLRVVTLLFVVACGSSASAPSPVVASAEFTNAQGQLVCPVMGDVIESHAAAVGHTEHEGKTYYFCCDSCQHMFADDPERYADGRFLAHLKDEHGGQFGDCHHVL